MTEVFINDFRLELSSNEIVQTFQLSDIGDISTRQTSYTNKFKAPRIPSNIAACNYVGIVGKEHSFEASQFPYGTPSAKIVESGIELVNSGLAQISETNSNYEITIYGSEKSFYEKIKDLTLQDCYPETLFTYNAENVANAFNRNDNFIFTLLYYNNSTRAFQPVWGGNNFSLPSVKFWTERMTPQFFWKDLFKNIFNYLGYTVVNPIATDARFINLLTNASTTVMNFNVQYGQEFNFKNVAPTMNCGDFIKEVMMRFGLLIRVNELEKRVEFIRFEDLITTSQVQDWSGKFDSQKNEVYKLGKYGRKNIFDHTSDSGDDIQNESVGSFYKDWADNEIRGSFNIKNSQLENDETTVFTSKFEKPKLVRYTKGEITETYSTETPGVWEFYGSLETGNVILYSFNKKIYKRTYHLIDMLEFEYNGDYPQTDYATVKNITKEFRPQVFSKFKVGFLVKMRLPDNTYQSFSVNAYMAQYQEEYEQFSAVVPIGQTSVPSLNFEEVVKNPLVSFQVFLDEHYPFTIKTLNKMKVVKCMMNLSIIDIYTLDFYKRKHIKQLGANFYLNKVGNFKPGKLTECELVKIPSNFEEESYYEKNSQMIGTL